MPPRLVAVPACADFRDGYYLQKLPEPEEVACPGGGHFLVDYEVKLKLSPESARKENRVFKERLKPKPQQNKKTGRWDLRLDLARGNNRGTFHTLFHRLVGLVLKKTGRDKDQLQTFAPPVSLPPVLHASASVQALCPACAHPAGTCEAQGKLGKRRRAKPSTRKEDGWNEYCQDGRKLQKRRKVTPRLWHFYEVDHGCWNNLDCRARNLRVESRDWHRTAGRDGWQRKSVSHRAKVALLRRPAASLPRAN